jgi:hypothetical protein
LIKFVIAERRNRKLKIIKESGVLLSKLEF